MNGSDTKTTERFDHGRLCARDFSYNNVLVHKISGS
jgi:hypothetical protein